MNFSEQWDKKENNSIRFNAFGLQIDVEIGGFSLRPEEYVVVMRDKGGKPFDMTIEPPDVPRSIGGKFYRHGIYLCPACSSSYDDSTVSLLEGLTPYTETEVICDSCETNHAYFKKDHKKDFSKKLGIVADFLNKRLVQVQSSKIQFPKRELPPDYLVVLTDKGRPFDITMESPEPARVHTKGGIVYKSFGIDRCPACAGPYEPPKIGSIEKLNANLETTVDCGFCKSDNVYFNKGRPVKLDKVTDFLDRRFIRPILKQKQ
jgi:hypothetical protein